MPRIFKGPSTAGPNRNFRSPVRGPAFIFFLAVFPDAVKTPALTTADQQAFSLAPKPERTSAIVSEAHADRTWLPPSLHPSAHLAVSELPPFPERASPLAAEVHPDVVQRPSLHPADHLAATEVPPKPERTTPLAAEVHADATRTAMRPAEYQSVTEISPLPIPAPVTVVLGWYSWFPDAIPPPRLPIVALQSFATSPAPERTSPLAFAWYPDAIARPSLHPALHLAVSGEEPRPEERIDLDWTPRFPDASLRLALPTAEHPFFALAPAPERTRPIAVEVHPDAVARQAQTTALHLAASELPPKPERTAALIGEADPQPARWMRPGDYQAFAEPLLPLDSPASLEWWPEYPDISFDFRIRFSPAPRSFVTPIDPQPNPPPPPPPPSSGGSGGGGGGGYYPAASPPAPASSPRSRQVYFSKNPFQIIQEKKEKSNEEILNSIFEQVETEFKKNPDESIDELLSKVVVPDVQEDRLESLIILARTVILDLLAKIKEKDEIIAELQTRIFKAKPFPGPTIKPPGGGRLIAGSFAAIVVYSLWVPEKKTRRKRK